MANARRATVLARVLPRVRAETTSTPRQTEPRVPLQRTVAVTRRPFRVALVWMTGSVERSASAAVVYRPLPSEGEPPGTGPKSSAEAAAAEAVTGAATSLRAVFQPVTLTIGVRP